MDRYLEQAQTGPHWLAQEEIAKLIEDALHYAQQVHHYIRLHAWVIQKAIPPGKPTKSWEERESLSGSLNPATTGYETRQSSIESPGI